MSNLNEWLKYCRSPDGQFVDEYSQIFTEIKTQEELRGYLPTNIFPLEVEKRILQKIDPLPFKTEESLKDSISADLYIMQQYAKDIGDHEIASAYSTQHFELTSDHSRLVDLHRQDIPSSWLLGIISDAYQDSSAKVNSPVSGLFEACYGITADFKASWHMCAPLFDLVPVNLEAYFQLYLNGIDYAVSKEAIFVHQRDK